MQAIIKYPDRNEYHVAHGGHSGDIIYTLPLVKYCSEILKKRIVYHVIANRPTTFGPDIAHPNGLDFNMNQRSFDFIKPLLSQQKYISDVNFTRLEELPVGCFKIDYYRDVQGLKLDSGNIQTWARKFFGYPIETESPWLKVSPNKVTPKVVCAFSRRYRNKSINYNFLDKLDSGFIGLDDEYQHFCEINKLKNLKRIKCADALQMASVIKSSKFFFGNQSFAFSIAESLKVNRALEVCEITPNVIPSGRGAHEYMNAIALDFILKKNLIFKEGLSIKESDYIFEHTLYFK